MIRPARCFGSLGTLFSRVKGLLQMILPSGTKPSGSPLRIPFFAPPRFGKPPKISPPLHLYLIPHTFGCKPAIGTSLGMPCLHHRVSKKNTVSSASLVGHGGFKNSYYLYSPYLTLPTQKLANDTYQTPTPNEWASHILWYRRAVMYRRRMEIWENTMTTMMIIA